MISSAINAADSICNPVVEAMELKQHPVSNVVFTPARAGACFAVHTLGCKANQYDTSQVARQLIARGWRQVPFPGPAEAFIVDTCTVTHVAHQKSLKTVRRLARRRPDSLIAVTGCAAAWRAADFESIGGVDLVVGNDRKGELAGLVAAALLRKRESGCGRGWERSVDDAEDVPTFGGRTRALVKVQDGCNHGCTYCIIPRTRGRETSRTVTDVVSEVRQLADEGYREVVLTGIRLGAYGRDRGHGQGELARLLHAIHAVEGISRIRLSSVDPLDVDQPLLTAVCDLPKVCPHLHLPLQSGDDEILSAMRRGYTVRDYRELVNACRQRDPDLALNTDVLVGFPGETREHFERTKRFCEEMQFSRMHVFPYSSRPRTLAARLPNQVPPAEKRARVGELTALARSMADRYARDHLHRLVNVLVEEVNSAGIGSAFTDTYVRVALTRAWGLEGQVVVARTVSVDDGQLQCQVEHNGLCD